MQDEDFMDWALERRLDMLSDQEELMKEEEAVCGIGEILQHSISPEEKVRLGFLLDRIRWGEKELYLKGIKDGIKVAKWVCGI